MKYGFILLLLMPALLSADVYKWTDANGKVHYGDRPGSHKAQELKIEPNPVSTGTTNTSSGDSNRESIDNWLKARDEERQIKKKQDAILKKEKALQKKECTRLQNELRDMQKGGVVWYDLDETGQRRYYSDKEIAQQVADLKETIRVNCR